MFFDKIINFFKKLKKIKEIKEKFLMEHNLPDRASETKMPLKWDINIKLIGDGYNIIIKQHNPTRFQLYRYGDNKVYRYNIIEKKLEIEEGSSWKLPEDGIGKFW